MEDDIPACEELCVFVHGFERTRELRDALAAPAFNPCVALREGRIVAYAATLDEFGAGVVVASGPPASFLLPLHQHHLLRWCLAAGLRIVKPMNYMVMGRYRRPQGAWVPSVLY